MNGKAIAKRLIMLRGEKSQKDVAQAVKISRSALAMYERGERVPRDEIKERLAEYYEMSVQDIFFARDEHKECTEAV